MTPPKPLTAEARIEALTDEVEHLRFLLEEMTALPPEWAGREEEYLSPSERAVLARIVKSGGETVPFGALGAAATFVTRGMDTADITTVRVLICKARKKLSEHGSPIRIRTVWGVGYALGGEA